jgi:acetyl esterase/lipase
MPDAKTGTIPPQHQSNLIFAGVDGTGADNDKEYRAAMAKSYVQRLSRTCRVTLGNAHYSRGPKLWGNETGSLGVAAAQFVIRQRDAAKTARIVLAGYSRGGAAVITAAQMLLVRGIKVDLMILFDAVDRSATAAAGIIPPNVAKVYHLRRSLRAFSRPYFGNCGTWYVPFATTYIERTFVCTHGGVGGCPWWEQPDRSSSLKITDRIKEGSIPTAVTYQEDLVGSRSAWQWIAEHLKAEKVL